MDPTTPTEEVVDQSSSDIRDESLLDDSEQTSAVEQETDSGEKTQDSDSSSSLEDNDDDNLSAFAKSQGYDPEALTANEKKLLGQLKKNSTDKRTAIDKTPKSTRRISDEIQDLSKPDENDGMDEIVLKRMARLESKEATNDFWAKPENKDNRKYESKMVEILNQEVRDYGKDAAWRLAQNLPRLLREAQSLSGDFSSDAARESGRRDEREKLRKLQEGAADGADASTTVRTSKTKIDAAWVTNTYDPNKPEDRAALDAAILAGELY